MSGLLFAGLLASNVVAGGYASRYAPTVFESVVTHRNANGWWPSPLPVDWYTVAGYAATTDCAQVGEVVLMRPLGDSRWHRVLVADCAGDRATLDWMNDNRIVVELDHDLWQRWAADYGAPLAIEVRQ